VSLYLASHQADIVKDLLEDEELFKKFYHVRWFQVTKGATIRNAASLLVHLLQTTARLIAEWCELAHHQLSMKYAHKLKLYTFFWRQFSISLVNLDQ
jgi:hypothetical protein